MKKKKVILELYMEIWYCYQDGKSMAYPLFTTTTYEDADNICKKRNYDVIQVIDLELQDFDDTPDHKTWWKGLNEEEQTKLCQKHFQGIPVESLMERSIKVMFHYENPETTTNTVTGGEWEVRGELKDEIYAGYEPKIRIAKMDGASNEQRANANRIVNCVNNFDSLVSALKDCVDMINNNCDWTKFNREENRTVEEAKQLLNKINQL